jgi:trans-aconitate methyltransferase
MSLTTAEKSAGWKVYYEARANALPSPLLVQALEALEPRRLPPQAIDLGCGGGHDTRELTRRGWQVLAIDAEAEALARVEASLPSAQRALAQSRVARFEALVTLPKVSLINASLSLPFCHPAHFGALWAALCAALPPNGYFAGHLFGERDEWATHTDMTFHTEAQARALFIAFALERFDEQEYDGTTALNRPKHWHIWHIVARKG